MRTLAVIPARLAATRLPRKPLRLLGGVPLIVRVWKRIHDMGVVDRVVVAADSDEITAVVRERGGEVAMTRTDHASGTDRVAEVVLRPEYEPFDLIANIQGDEPFVQEDALRGAIGLVGSGRFSLATAAAAAPPEIAARADVVKVVCADDGRALYFSRAGIPFLRDDRERALRDVRIRQHIGIYVYTRKALQAWVALPPHDLERIERLEQLRPLAAGMVMGVHIVDTPAPPGVDTEEDLSHANSLWDDLYAGRL